MPTLNIFGLINDHFYENFYRRLLISSRMYLLDLDLLPQAEQLRVRHLWRERPVHPDRVQSTLTSSQSLPQVGACFCSKNLWKNILKRGHHVVCIEIYQIQMSIATGPWSDSTRKRFFRFLWRRHLYFLSIDKRKVGVLHRSFFLSRFIIDLV